MVHSANMGNAVDLNNQCKLPLNNRELGTTLTRESLMPLAGQDEESLMGPGKTTNTYKSKGKSRF